MVLDVDKKYLKEQQYKSSGNLEARIAIHERFRTNPESFHKWIWDNMKINQPIKVLEVGCGNGNLTQMLRGKFEIVVPMDINPRGNVEGLCIADARSLPFPDNYFGTIVSSNVLEHIDDPLDSLFEFKRVLKDDGIMIHTMPTRTWKLLQIALWPLHIIIRVGFTKVLLKFRDHLPISKSDAITQTFPQKGNVRDERRKPDIWAVVFPGIHGIADTHLDEWKLFGKSTWLRLFESGGLHVLKTTNLFLHSAYRFLPYRALKLRDWASRLGIVSVRGYWISKNGK